jgi:preprotein translocase subunit SecE
MKVNTEQKSTQFDGAKWGLVVLLIAAAVAGNQYYAVQPLLYRVLGIVALAAMAGLVALQTGPGIAFWNLAKAARVEIRKVVWPTRQETTQTTLIVVAVVLLMALILWGLDALLGWIVSSVIG